MKGESAAIDIPLGQVLLEAEFDVDAVMAVWRLKFLLFAFATIPLYGVGLVCLIFYPLFAWNQRESVRSQRLVLTTEHVIYYVNSPCCGPCCGTTQVEKHVMLGLITDVEMSQGCVQSKYGLWTLRIENPGQGGGGGDGKQRRADLSVDGVRGANRLKRVLLAAAIAKRSGHALAADFVARCDASGGSGGLEVGVVAPAAATMGAAVPVAGVPRSVMVAPADGLPQTPAVMERLDAIHRTLELIAEGLARRA